MLISVDVAIFPYNCSDQTNNVRRPESIPGKSQPPHLNTFDHKSTEFMITFLELFPHSSFILCRELSIVLIRIKNNDNTSGSLLLS